MIKDVLNSITTNSQAEKSSHKNGSSDETASKGFFEKMLMAFQNGEEQAEQAQAKTGGQIPEESEKQRQENEGNSSNSENSALKNQALNLTEKQKSLLAFRGVNAEEVDSEVSEQSQKMVNVEGELSDEANVLTKGNIPGEVELEKQSTESVENEESSEIKKVGEAEADILLAGQALNENNIEVDQGEGKQPKQEVPKDLAKEGISVQAEKTAENTEIKTGGEMAKSAALNQELMNDAADMPNSAIDETVAAKAESTSAELKAETIAQATTDVKAEAEGADTLIQKEGASTSKVKNTSEASMKNQTAAKAVITEEQGERKQLLNNASKVSSEAEKGIQNQQFLKQKAGQVNTEIQSTFQSSKSEETREKRYGLNQQNSGENPLATERLEPVAATGKGNSGTGGFNFSKAPEWLKQQNNTSSSILLNKEQEAIFEQLMESPDGQENQKVEQSGYSYARLGDIPITNTFLRRNVLPGLTSTLMKANPSENANAQHWQKHNFELDDGNKIKLSTRNVDGVIQVKLASSNVELSRLLQQYGHEIREHLEQECELNIDLQFEDTPEQEMTDFFSDSSSSGEERSNRGQNTMSDHSTAKQAEQNLQNSVRKFGYNRMEWTA